MDDDDSARAAIDGLVEQLSPYAKNADSGSRFRVDMIDLAEIAEWFLSILISTSGKTFDEEELENFLIELDVRLIDHSLFHLNSLREELTKLLDKFPNEDS